MATRLVGVDGDFRLNDRLSFLGQVTVHWADFEHTQFLLTGMAGFAFHF